MKSFGLTFLLLVAVLQPTKAYSLNCRAVVGLELGAAAPDQVKLSIRDRLLLIKSKIVPVFQNRDFELRIVHNKDNPNLEQSPVDLQNRIISAMKQAATFFRENGLEAQSYVQVVAEANQGGVKYALNRDGEKELPSENLVSLQVPFIGPYLVESLKFRIVLPGLLKPEVPMLEKTMTADHRYSAMVMVLPVLDGAQSASSSKFVIAHEYVHLTEGRNLKFVPLWQETRADLIASLITGETGFYFPNFAEINESVQIVEGTRSRTLEADELRRASQHIEEKSYHFNSEILSQFLFKAQQAVKKPVILDFIKWFDAHLEDPSKTFFKYMIEGSLSPYEQIYGTAQVFGVWAATQDLSVDELSEVNRLILSIQ